MGHNFEEWDQHESTTMQFGMGKNEATALASAHRPAEAPAPIVEDVDVQAARPPLLNEPPARTVLDAFQQTQQRAGSEACVCKHNGVEITPLVSWSERGRRVDPRRGYNVHAFAP
jgi:hypothetical protein